MAHPKSDGPVCLALVEQAVATDPFDAQAWYNLGVFQSERGDLAGALAAYRRAVQFEPLYADALGNGCELLRRFDRFEESLDWADRQLALGQGGWAAHLNRAISLFHLFRLDEADQAFEAARALGPDRAIIAWERFAPLLHRRRFAEAWDAFDQRFAVGRLNGVFHYPFPQPTWRGEPLRGKHLVVHNEQGLGDQIMFASALPEVIGAAKQVSLVVSPELEALFRASFPDARVFPARVGRFAGDHPEPAWLSELGRVDYQIPFGGLMGRLRRTPESFARFAPYLRPSGVVRARWADAIPQLMPAAKGLRIGLCWASNPALFRHDSSRRAMKKSMALETLAPLLGVEHVQFVSVLNWPIDPATPSLDGRVLDLSGALISLDETAAVIEQLDLVIAVDTAVAHLAGALGAPTWLMLHEFADCRWGLEGEHSYWYPSLRLFRQPTPGDWGAVVQSVQAGLETRLRAKPA